MLGEAKLLAKEGIGKGHACNSSVTLPLGSAAAHLASD
jgi:hypothetical protein